MEQHGIPLVSPFDVRKIFTLFEYEPYAQGIRSNNETCSFWELIWTQRGSAVFQVARSLLPLSEGTVVLLPPDIPHSCLSAEQDTKLFYLTFLCAGESIDEIGARPIRPTQEETQLLEAVSRHAGAFHWQDAVCAGSGMRMEDDTPPVILSMLKLQIESLLVLLYTNHPTPQPLSSGVRRRSDSRRFSQAVTFMEAHLDGSVTPELLADEVNVTVSVLRRLFRDSIGMGVTEYYNHLRIEKAKEYLREGEYNISQIAERLGYCSPFYFSRVFKAATGAAPSAYLSKK